jgi:Asp-tRNA(Asn)/Glu-tRNA(Gln) amidotransferase A subunit family amidase
MARDPLDLALGYGVLEGLDPADPATAETAFELPNRNGHGGLRLGVAGTIAGACLSPGAARVLDAARDALAALGAEVIELQLPDSAETLQTFVVTQRAEVVAYHRSRGLYPDRVDEYGADVRGRLELADRVTLSDYIAAQTTRQWIRARWRDVFAKVDAVLTPVSAISPPMIGQEMIEHNGTYREMRDLIMVYTVPQNLTGLPSCAIRAGFDDDGMPVAVQFTGPWWAETRVLDCAQALAEATADVQAVWPRLATRFQ